MWWILSIVAIFVAVIAVVAIVGMLMPQSHIVSRSVQVKQSPDVIFNAITDWTSFPNWREGVKGVKERTGEAGRVSWIEVTSFGEIPLEILESHSPDKLVVRIADPKLPFGGIWTYDIQPAPGGGSTFTITEAGDVYNPIFRVMSKYIFGHAATIEAYQRSLKKKFGE